MVISNDYPVVISKFITGAKEIEVDAVADRVLLINQGKLVFDGLPEDLKENGSLEQKFYRLTQDREVSPHSSFGDIEGPQKVQVKD